MKHILVAGGAGFIGSHLCEALLKEGEKVFCLDNLSTGRMVNIEPLLRHSQFTFIPFDVEEPLVGDPRLATVFTDGIDEIFNFASPASPIHYQRDPIKTIRSNVFGIINLLDAATLLDATILQASTSEIYGDSTVHPQVETYCGNVNPIGVRACYDEAKRCAETLCFEYGRQRGTKIKVVRIFNTYGPNLDPADGRAISNFVNQALENRPVTVYGDGGQTRSFCYVEDLIRGLLLMMGSDPMITGPVNLGNPEEHSILDVARMVLKLTQSASEVVHLELPMDDPCKRKPDISLAKKTLGWEPCIPLAEGIKRCFDAWDQRGTNHADRT